MPFRVPPRLKNAGAGSLFPKASSTASAPAEYLVANIDGGARGNPGPAGYGVILKDSSGETLAELSAHLGVRTNNYAEYSALIAALEWGLQQGRSAIKVISDSELLVKQMRGEYKVKSPELRQLYLQARVLVEKLKWFKIEHVLRHQNRGADRLANAAMDKVMGSHPIPPGDDSTQPQRTGVKPANVKFADVKLKTKEMVGIVRGGVVELLSSELPEGTRVIVRKLE